MKLETREQLIKQEREKVEELNSLIESEFIEDLFCPGGFRKPMSSEIKNWKEKKRHSESIIYYLERTGEYDKKVKQAAFKEFLKRFNSMTLYLGRSQGKQLMLKAIKESINGVINE